MPAEKVECMIQSLDSTLFQYNMRGWREVQSHICTYKDKFIFFSMATKSGQKGFMAVCKECDQLCKFECKKADARDAPILEQCRYKLRQYMGYGTAENESKKQRMV